MSGLRLVNAIDMVRSLGADPATATRDSVANELSEYVKRKGGKFNYDVPTKLLKPGFEGAICEVDAIARCEEHWHKAGRLHCAAALKSVWPHLSANHSTCYARSFAAVQVGAVSKRGVFVGSKIPLVRVVARQSLLVVPMFRRGHRLAGKQIDFYLSYLRAQALREGYPNIDIEYLDSLPVGEAGRVLQVSRASERNSYTLDFIDDRLDVYVKAVAFLFNQGVGDKPPMFTGYRVLSDDEPSLPL
ncbi:MAG TPA: hypothetical protein DCL48_16860 [Alphaproteobacteria bacterium]|nr:hypothetical protein [Alphaproteobacteria bacterium]